MEEIIVTKKARQHHHGNFTQGNIWIMSNIVKRKITKQKLNRKKSVIQLVQINHKQRPKKMKSNANLN